VAQGRKAVTVGGEIYLYDPFRYLVLSSHLHFQAEILEAWPADITEGGREQLRAIGFTI
jgi:hypothetical protein